MYWALPHELVVALELRHREADSGADERAHDAASPEALIAAAASCTAATMRA